MTMQQFLIENYNGKSWNKFGKNRVYVNVYFCGMSDNYYYDVDSDKFFGSIDNATERKIRAEYEEQENPNAKLEKELETRQSMLRTQMKSKYATQEVIEENKKRIAELEKALGIVSEAETTTEEKIEEVVDEELKKQEEEQRQEELEKAEIVIPENAKSTDIIKIENTDTEITVSLSKNNNEAREIIKEQRFQFDWDRTCWYLKLDARYPTTDDKTAEIGNLFLNIGFAISVKNKEIAEMAINGNFKPTADRIVCYYENQFNLFFEKNNDELYNYLKKIPTAKYNYSKSRGSYFTISSQKWDVIQDTIDIWNFEVSEGAKKLLETTKEEYQKKKKITPKQVEKKKLKGGVKDILSTSEDVLQDLIDDD